MPIRILTDEVASQIAAGEVVERPASVVKELAENALDARATQVTVQIADAGRRLIEVSDDGAGIAFSEMELAVARHATSKLNSADDLFTIQTLGFRGEALASIASVSRFTLISRQRDSDSDAAKPLGAKLVVEGGFTRGVEPVGVPVGTVVRVEDLFYNVPARLKFLKRDLTERQQIDGLVTRYALAYPNVRFHLVQDGRPVLQTTGRGDRREVLANLYGIDTAKQMLEVTLEDEKVRVSGFISPVALTRSNRREITFFVNGRWVQDASLAAALIQAYHTLIMVGRYPLAALFVDLPPEEVDVNVHPAKAEVRFRSPDVVFSGVQRAVRRALLAYSPVPTVTQGTWQRPLTQQAASDAEEISSGASSRPSLGWQDSDSSWDMRNALLRQPPVPDDEEAAILAPTETEKLAAQEQSQPGQGTQANELLPTGSLPLLRLIGQVGLTYLIAEGPDGLYLIDQHAAHERVLFERFMQQRRQSGGTIHAQALLEPATVHLSSTSAALLQSQLGVLEGLGFEIEPFGPNTFRVRAIPALFLGADPQAAVRVLVEDFEEDEAPLQAEIEAKIIARVCKRAAVKAGQTLSSEEQRTLLRDLEACRSPRTCPHGRPTMIHLSVDLLERQFGRRGGR